MLGLTQRPTDIGRPFPEVLTDCPEVTRVLQQAFDSADLPNRAEMRLRKTGRAIGYTLSHIHDDDDRMVGATLFFKDLTRVEQLEERERLRDRLATLGEMAAAIAHEVKNPLASIEVMAGVLKRQLPNESEALETLNDIIKEAKMANAIVVEVLEFVRPIQLQVERAALDDVHQGFHHAGRGQDARAAPCRSACTSRRTCRSCSPTRTSCASCFRTFSPTRSKRSAAKVTSRFARTLLPGEEEPAGATEPQPPQVVVEVRDNGPGISPDDLERIFSPFFTTKPQGTGLGLAIVRKVVDAHDGHIDAVSARGHGATFRVTLPVVPSERSMGR